VTNRGFHAAGEQIEQLRWTARPIELVANLVVEFTPAALLRVPERLVLIREFLRLLEDHPPQFHERLVEVIDPVTPGQASRRRRQRYGGGTGERFDER